MAFPDGWTKYKTIPLNGSSDGEQTNYQTPELTVTWETGMGSDFGDVRFTDSDGTTELYYHLIEYTADTSATFVLKVPTIPTGGKTLYMYFGKSGETTTSDPENVYLFYDGATGTFSDKWTNIQGTGSYNTVGGKTAIKLGSSTTNIRTNTFQITYPFKIEAELYTTAVITQIQYCQTSTPTTGVRYYARIDVRGGAEEGVIKDGTFLGTHTSVFGSSSTWVNCELTFDQNGVHTWIVDGNTLGGAADTTYTAGYIVLNHHNSGTGAVANLKISKYTANFPTWGSWGNTIVFINDSGETTELINIKIGLSDNCSGIDGVIATQNTSSLNDSATASDIPSIPWKGIQLIENPVASELSSISNSFLLSDSGTADELAALIKNISDGGVGNESVNCEVSFLITDSGTSEEIASYIRQLNLLERRRMLESVLKINNDFTLTDVISPAEELDIANVRYVGDEVNSDIQVYVDVTAVYHVVELTDVGSSTEKVNLIVRLSERDEREEFLTSLKGIHPEEE